MLKDFKALASHLAPAGEDTILTNSYQIKSNAIPNQSDSKTGQFETRAQATQQIRKNPKQIQPRKSSQRRSRTLKPPNFRKPSTAIQ